VKVLRVKRVRLRMLWLAKRAMQLRTLMVIVSGIASGVVCGIVPGIVLRHDPPQVLTSPGHGQCVRSRIRADLRGKKVTLR
jgi:hypothetical protein